MCIRDRSAAVCSSLNPTGQNTAPAVPPEFTGDRKQKVNGKGGLLWTVRDVYKRQVLELAGYKNIRSKALGSNNKQNVVLATIAGLKEIRCV